MVSIDLIRQVQSYSKKEREGDKIFNNKLLNCHGPLSRDTGDLDNGAEEELRPGVNGESVGFAFGFREKVKTE